MVAWSGLDQRSFPRVDAECDIWIQGKAGLLIRAKTENVGGGGVCVILKQELEKLSRVHLRLALPSQSIPIDCNGRVVWTVKSTDPSSKKITYDTGIEFLDLDEAQQAIALSVTHNPQ
jgi:hypothetical protein